MTALMNRVTFHWLQIFQRAALLCGQRLRSLALGGAQWPRDKSAGGGAALHSFIFQSSPHVGVQNCRMKLNLAPSIRGNKQHCG